MNIEKNAGEKVIYDLPSTLFKMSPYFPNGMFVVYVLKGRIPRRRSTSVSVWATSLWDLPRARFKHPRKTPFKKRLGGADARGADGADAGGRAVFKVILA